VKRRDFLISTATLSASLLPSLARGQAGPCPPSRLSVEGGTSADTSCNPGDAEADWLLRTGQDPSHPQPGVVWFHDFRSDAEVDAFRWTGGYRGGNDPRAIGSEVANLTRRNTSDGVTGGGCLEILRPAGTRDGSHWWRPFSPLPGSGNGRGVDDPAANGTLAIQPYQATDGGSQVYDWGRRGYYGHASYHEGSVFDGTSFYLQMRVKMDPRRTAAGNSLVGKLTFLTTTRWSLTTQELVTYSASRTDGVGTPNYFRIYGGGNSDPLDDKDSIGRRGNQPGSELGVCDMSSGRNCWAWSGGWDTIMYHLTPGRAGVVESVLQVYAAHPGETSYTKIWDQTWANGYEYSGGSPYVANGYNALICSIYQNGLRNTEFWHRYDQIIFSKSFIPCPQV